MSKISFRWHRRHWILLLLILLIDIFSKFLTQSMLPLMSQAPPSYPYGGVAIFQNFLGIEFSISYTTNTGAAWGLFSNAPMALLLFRLLMVSGLFSYALFFNTNKRLSLPLVLLIAGALGNILDFFFYSHVIDMLHFVLWGYDYPVFNVADVAIFVGISWIILLSFLTEETKKT